MSNREKVLVLVDPVSCGVRSLERAMADLDPERHSPTLLVVARDPSGSGDDGHAAPEFAYADAALATYREILARAGFTVDGWVAPDRRSQLRREVEARGPYGRALAVSPSGRWRRLVERDVTGMLHSVGIPAELHCN